MKFSGLLKTAAVLGIDFLAAYYLVGWEIALILTVGVLLYALFGEYLALWKDGAIAMNHLQEQERTKLSMAHTHLGMDISRTDRVDISRIHFRVIPSDEINAFAYGLRNVAVTRGTLRCTDDATLCAVLAHELSHTFHMDAIFSRVVFATVTLIIVGLIVASFATTSVLWIIFAALCGLGICGGLLSLLFFRGMTNFVTGFFNLLQRGVVFIYQTAMGFVNRACEYRADRYSCRLGYGHQLSYFLTRFVQASEGRQKTLAEVIYATHPATHKRVLRIEQGDYAGT